MPPEQRWEIKDVNDAVDCHSLSYHIQSGRETLDRENKDKL